MILTNLGIIRILTLGRYFMKLSIATSNRNRFYPSSNASKWFIKSLEQQTLKDFELVIADGGSNNIEKLECFANNFTTFPIKIIRFPIGEKFERSRLNNVAIRNSSSDYIMTTDVDMFFSTLFLETLFSHCSENTFVESRTMYWRQSLADQIYDGKLDPFNDINNCRIGRLKKRTTAGGCQCANKILWDRVRGFDEKYIGWGSEDVDLLKRMTMSGAKIKWLGEEPDSIMLFHQPHDKPNIKGDLEDQDVNKRILNHIDNYVVNKDGWGGQNEDL